MTALQAPPVVVTIAGSDSSGGAGIQADLKTFAALGVYGASTITALTAQNTRGVFAVHPVPAEFVAQQYNAITDDLDVAAIKIGMLATAEIATTIADCLEAAPVPATVLDPVMVATSGAPLIDVEAVDVITKRLFPLATLVTPNRAEAARLTNTPPYNTPKQRDDQARAILDLGARAVLIKGGHDRDGPAIARDLLVTPSHTQAFERPRIATTNTHGTGCTLSSAIAAHLARGMSLPDTIEASKEYVWRALDSARNLKIGSGNGPLHHAFALR